MVILACLGASIILAALAWRKGWKKKSLWPVICLFIISALDWAVQNALSDIPGFSLIVGIIFVAWSVYMALIPPRATKGKK
jgi:hypothetical protein